VEVDSSSNSKAKGGKDNKIIGVKDSKVKGNKIIGANHSSKIREEKEGAGIGKEVVTGRVTGKEVVTGRVGNSRSNRSQNREMNR